MKIDKEVVIIEEKIYVIRLSEQEARILKTISQRDLSVPSVVFGDQSPHYREASVLLNDISYGLNDVKPIND